MKEATGELSTTMIAVVAIAAILTIFTVILLPYLRESIQSRLHCVDAYGCTECSNGKCKCKYTTGEGTAQQEHDIRCTDPNHEIK